jgi:hypothetical protein
MNIIEYEYDEKKKHQHTCKQKKNNKKERE